MPNICDALLRRQFVGALETCEAAGYGVLTEWDLQFVEGLRKRFDSREDAEDLGITPWSPSAKQWNLLMQLAGKSR